MIARAKRIDNGELVEGYVKNCTDTGLDVFWIQTKEWIDYQIDPSTLKYSFNGVKFYSEDILELLTARYEAMLIKGLSDETNTR